MQGTAAKTKDAGKFTFGVQDDFVRGLQGRIGLPNRLNKEQWSDSIAAEHCGVDPNEPDSEVSDRNYNLHTSPRAEYGCRALT